MVAHSAFEFKHEFQHDIVVITSQTGSCAPRSIRIIHLIPLFHQDSSRAGLEWVPNLEPALHVSTAEELTLSQENWFQRETSTLRVLQPRFDYIRGWGRDYHD